MNRAISSHKHLIELLTAGTKADFVADSRHHLKYTHDEAGSIR